MSSSITKCPGCYTRFKVTTEQLAAHDGIVRCGLCSAIFNATEHLQDDEPSPQLSLPISQEGNEAPPEKVIAEVTSHAEHIPMPAVTGTEELETLFQQIEAADEFHIQDSYEPKPKPLRWPWIVASVLLLLAGLAQGLYFYRIEIAAQLPGLKPALLSYCELLKCSIPLPEKVDLMNIESSDLEADPQLPNAVNLTALIHNRAEYVLAYPNLELSLTDTQDRVLARRVFKPSEYLKTGDEENLGLASNREVSIKLHLDTMDLKPTGYKLLLFYPQ